MSMAGDGEVVCLQDGFTPSSATMPVQRSERLDARISACRSASTGSRVSARTNGMTLWEAREGRRERPLASRPQHAPAARGRSTQQPGSRERSGVL